jgi:hypothetical protein
VICENVSAVTTRLKSRANRKASSSDLSSEISISPISALQMAPL